MSKSIRQQVLDQVKFDMEQGVNVLALGYEECNDYAQTVTNVLSVRNKAFYRFETVARRIREFKETQRKANSL